MDDITLTLNASRLLPGIMPPQALRVTVDEDMVAHLIRVNGPRLADMVDGPLEAVARTLLRVSTGAMPSFEQEKMHLAAVGDIVLLMTPGSGIQIELSRAGLEELACRLVMIHRDMEGSLMNCQQQGKPLHEIPVGKLVNNRISQEVEEIDLL